VARNAKLPLSFGRWTNTYSGVLQFVLILLDQTKTDVFNNQVQFIIQPNKNSGPGADSKTDVSMAISLNQANVLHGDHLPWNLDKYLHLPGPWSAGFAEQVGVAASLTRPLGTPQGQATVNLSVDLIHWNGDKNVLALTGQFGPYVNVVPPNEPNGSLGVVTGFAGLVGLTYAYSKSAKSGN
jgi:hypothetical protein